MQIKSLDTSISVDRSDVEYLEYLKCGEHKLRISIRSNSYKFQCHAVLKRMNPEDLTWHEVVHLQPLKMSTEAGLCYKPASIKGVTNAADFKGDRDALVSLFKKVVA